MWTTLWKGGFIYSDYCPYAWLKLNLYATFVGQISMHFCSTLMKLVGISICLYAWYHLNHWLGFDRICILYYWGELKSRIVRESLESVDFYSGCVDMHYNLDKLNS